MTSEHILYATVASAKPCRINHVERERNVLDWAGIGIIVGVQVATFLYTLRRMEAVRNDLCELKSDMDRLLTRLEGILMGRQAVDSGALTQTGDD